MKKIIGSAAAIASMLAVVGCGSAQKKTPTVTSSPSSIPSVAPKPTVPPGLKFGQTYSFSDGTATMTLYGYKHNATGFGSTYDKSTVYGALDIKYCLKRAPAGYEGVEISGSPWSLKFGDGSYQSTGSSGGEAMRPEYPEGKKVRVGECIRGWLDFEVPENGKLTEVQYAARGESIVSWYPR